MIFSPNQRRVLVALARGATLTHRPVDIDSHDFGWRLDYPMGIESRHVNGPAVAGLAAGGYLNLAQHGDVTIAHLAEGGRLAAENFMEAEEGEEE